VPLELPNVIDIILQAEADGRVVLVITDAGVTTDPAQRMDCLMKKLKAYVSAIVSGGLTDDYPNHTAKDFKIRVVCTRRPTSEMANISRVTPRGDLDNAIPVEFEEYPAGAWSAPHDDSPPADPFHSNNFEEAEKAEDSAEPLDPVWVEAGKQALSLADERLATGQKGFCFAIVASDAGSEVVTFCEEGADEQIMNQANQYVRDLPPAFTVCVVATESSGVKINGKEHDAIMLISHVRGQAQGFCHAKPFRRKSTFFKYKVIGPLELLGPIPNLLGTPS
jgi:hypothetical protein